ncbi:MAG: serine hydrolase domain-containing protein [Gemmatimonadaceae bacterium]
MLVSVARPTGLANAALAAVPLFLTLGAQAPPIMPANAAPALLTERVSGVLQRALADSAFPGAVAVIGNRHGILLEHAVGRIDWNDTTPPEGHTLWDMASLTKVVALTSSLMSLVQERRVKLDAPVQRYIPEFTGRWKSRVTVRHLLTHSSGLPNWRPLYKEAPSPAAALALAIATPLDTLPGVRMSYSDLGAIILGEIVHRASGMPLDRFAELRIFAPLGMSDTRFRPDSSLRSRIAPTEIDPWRQRHLRGEVHDENAYALGGVSGHAGLFGCAHDLAQLARAYLNGGSLGGSRIWSARTIELFTRPADSRLSHRALGWETANGSNSAGRYMSAKAFGHTGFTGTSMWIDPENDVFVILLTNRVNPTRENRRIGAVRSALADSVMLTIGSGPLGSVRGKSLPDRN